MAGMTGFQGGMLGLALVAVALGVAQQTPAPREPVQPAAQAAVAPAAAPVTTLVPPAVALMDGSLLDLTRPGAQDSAAVPLFVINRDASRVGVSFHIALSDSVTGRDTSYAASVEPDTVDARRVQVLRLRIPPGWRDGDGIQKGHLTMTAVNGTAPAALSTRPIRIAPAARAPWLMNLVLGAGFLLGLLIVAIAWARHRPPRQAAPLVWSRDSWATNLAIVASALVTFSGLAAPSVVFHYMTRAQYTSLGALIAGVILLANALYAFAGADRSSGGLARFALFVVLTATLGAALSQLVTLGFLVREAFEASVITRVLYYATSGIIALTVVALLWYAYQTIGKLAPQPAPVPAGERGKALPPQHEVPDTDAGVEHAANAPRSVDASEKAAEPPGVKVWRLP